MIELKSPCLECELKDQNKSNPTCRDCEKRVKYCAALGGLSSSVPDSVSLGGDTTRRKNTRSNAEGRENNMEPATQICKDTKCGSAGQPRSIEDFQVHGPSGKRLEICRECMGRRKREGHAAKKKKAPAKKAAPKPATETAGKKMKKIDSDTIVPAETQLTIDFAQHPDVLKKIKEVAKDKIREPENQVLYWLKEFALLKEEGAA